MTDTEEASSPRRSPRGRLVLTVLACAAILFGLGQTPWLNAQTRTLAGTETFIAVQGSDAAPVVIALALVAAAAAFTFAIGRRGLALGSAGVITLTGIVVVAAVVQALTNPVGAAAGAVAENTGILGGSLSVSATAWPYPAAVIGVLLAGTGIRAIRTAARVHNVAPTRYARHAEATDASPTVNSAAAWDSLSHGHDPTL